MTVMSYDINSVPPLCVFIATFYMFGHWREHSRFSDRRKLVVHLQWKVCLVSSDCTMWRLLAGFVLLLCTADATPVALGENRTVPDFGKMYHVKGELNLPYSDDSGLKEPFEVWYDLEGNRSRIDYRNSTVRTFLIGNDLDYGVIYKITPVPIKEIKYFQLKGTKEDPIHPQAALPDLQGFEFEKMEDFAGVQCEVWKKVTQAGHKKNTYRLWVKRPEGSDSPAVPYHFEMEGFNTLLESHNDKYMIDYSDFSSQTESDIFTPPGGMTYEEFPNPPEEHQILANPLQDYVSTSPVSHAHRLFGPFKEKFERQYESEKEHEERENYFVHSLRFVHSTNRAGLSFSVGINDFADRSEAEMARRRGLIIPERKKTVTE